MPIITKEQAEALVGFIREKMPAFDDDYDFCCASDAVDTMSGREDRMIDLIRAAANE